MSQPATYNPADYQDYHRKKPQQQQWPNYQSQAPPFQGPPPMPSSMANVSASQWSNGYWSLNPNLVSNPGVAPPSSSTSSAPATSATSGGSKPATFYPSQVQQPNAASWMPGYAWGGQAQKQPAAQSDYNPYKRQPKPPSAEYLAMPQIENALGLHDMNPRDQVYRPVQEGVAHTPWVWNPRSLDKEEDESVVTADYKVNGRVVHKELRLESANGGGSRSRRGTAEMEAEVQQQPPQQQQSYMPQQQQAPQQTVQQQPQSQPQAGHRSGHGYSSASAQAEAQAQARSQQPVSHSHSQSRPTTGSSTATYSQPPQQPQRHQSDSLYSRPSSTSSASSTSTVTPGSQQPQQQAQPYHPQRHASAPAIYGPPASSIQQQQQQQSHYIAPPQPHAVPAHSHSQPHPQSQPPQDLHAEAFTSRQPLQPTFSPKIVRTPDYYRTLSTLSPSAESSPSSASASRSSRSVSASTSVTSFTPSESHREKDRDGDRGRRKSAMKGSSGRSQSYSEVRTVTTTAVGKNSSMPNVYASPGTWNQDDDDYNYGNSPEPSPTKATGSRSGSRSRRGSAEGHQPQLSLGQVGAHHHFSDVQAFTDEPQQHVPAPSTSTRKSRTQSMQASNSLSSIPETTTSPQGYSRPYQEVPSRDAYDRDRDRSRSRPSSRSRGSSPNVSPNYESSHQHQFPTDPNAYGQFLTTTPPTTSMNASAHTPNSSSGSGSASTRSSMHSRHSSASSVSSPSPYSPSASSPYGSTGGSSPYPSGPYTPASGGSGGSGGRMHTSSSSLTKMNAPGAYLGIQPDSRSRSISPNPHHEGRRSLDGGTRSGYNPLPPPPKESVYSTANPEISRGSRSSHNQSYSQSQSANQSQSRSHTHPTLQSSSRTPSSSRSHPTTPPRSSTSASQQAQQRHRVRDPESELEHFHGVPAPPSPPPPISGGSYTRMRIGYWNAHGDHLTPQGEVLISPPRLERPPELSGYPKVGKGFLDDIGRWKDGDDAIEIRSDSKGRVKDRPFESYIIYRNVPTSSTSIEQRLAPTTPHR